MCSPNNKEANPPGTEGEELECSEGEKGSEENVIRDGLEILLGLDGHGPYKQFGFTLKLEAISEVQTEGNMI